MKGDACLFVHNWVEGEIIYRAWRQRQSAAKLLKKQEYLQKKQEYLQKKEEEVYLYAD
jgi:hypothetical protein